MPAQIKTTKTKTKTTKSKAFLLKSKQHCANMRLISKDKMRARNDRVKMLNLSLQMGKMMT